MFKPMFFFLAGDLIEIVKSETPAANGVVVHLDAPGHDNVILPANSSQHSTKHLVLVSPTTNHYTQSCTSPLLNTVHGPSLYHDTIVAADSSRILRGSQRSSILTLPAPPVCSSVAAEDIQTSCSVSNSVSETYSQHSTNLPVMNSTNHGDSDSDVSSLETETLCSASQSHFIQTQNPLCSSSNQNTNSFSSGISTRALVEAIVASSTSSANHAQKAILLSQLIAQNSLIKQDGSSSQTNHTIPVNSHQYVTGSPVVLPGTRFITSTHVQSRSEGKVDQSSLSSLISPIQISNSDLNGLLATSFSLDGNSESHFAHKENNVLCSSAPSSVQGEIDMGTLYQGGTLATAVALNSIFLRNNVSSGQSIPGTSLITVPVDSVASSCIVTSATSPVTVNSTGASLLQGKLASGLQVGSLKQFLAWWMSSSSVAT